MSKYRKKPVVVDAQQWTGQPLKGVTGLRASADGQGSGFVQTPEGPQRINIGDYIVTDAKGAQHPCPKDIFLATYEPVRE